ncbi:MAG: toll/interleukin-1 receptor domain-containing protein [Prevotellaceae bacterium]|nr:toll/interleukin-1 receptor domain-containing protein [Candidatus Minthosoma caballi]
MKSKKYDIFISYRRSGGSERAEMLYNAFKSRGIREDRIFMDTHKLGNGIFKAELVEAIKSSSNFVVLITKGCFNSTKDKELDNWYLEIETALELKKNIIPVYFEDIDEMLKQIPSDFEHLKDYNSVRYVQEYAEAVYDKIVGMLIFPKEESHRIWKFVASGLFSIVFVVCYAFLYQYYHEILQIGPRVCLFCFISALISFISSYYNYILNNDSWCSRNALTNFVIQTSTICSANITFMSAFFIVEKCGIKDSLLIFPCSAIILLCQLLISNNKRIGLWMMYLVGVVIIPVHYFMYHHKLQISIFIIIFLAIYTCLFMLKKNNKRAYSLLH